MNLRLVAAPGETEDQIFVWYEEHGVLFCGDNYYGCWPNLYAIRGERIAMSPPGSPRSMRSIVSCRIAAASTPTHRRMRRVFARARGLP
ncbi:MAG: hypothetical protein R2845_10840 [Thermomicrobiales bacterium]